jgi:monovalent cation:H+ antiporter, CPA1 family
MSHLRRWPRHAQPRARRVEWRAGLRHETGRADRIASPGAVQVLLQNADALAEGARSEGRVGYRRAAAQALSFSTSFRAAYFVHRHLGIVRPLGDRLAERVELLLITRLLLDKLLAFNDRRLGVIFGKRIAKITCEMIRLRQQNVALGALRRQYPDYLAALEVRSLRQSALRQEMVHYKALFDEGLIPRELYDDLNRGVAAARTTTVRPRLDLGPDTRKLVKRLDILSGLGEQQLNRVARLLQPRFTVPGEVSSVRAIGQMRLLHRIRCRWSAAPRSQYWPRQR